MKLRQIVPALTLLVITAPALAGGSDGSFAIKDFGANKCSDFVAQIQAKNEAQINRYVGWLAGYFSAINEISPETFDTLSWQNMRTVSLMLMKHCEQNPEDRFATAVARLRLALQADRLVSQSPMIKITSGKQFFYIYQETLRRTQEKLKQAGFNPGPIDGLYGKTTASALKQFQIKNKLPPRGLPDQQTLYLLMLKNK